MLYILWQFLWPLLFVVLLWWLTTVVMLYRTGLPERTYFSTMLAASLLALLSLFALVHASTSTTVLAALQSFTAGMLLWGWHEISYYTGTITGPRAQACPQECSLGQRFRFGLLASLWHELAIVITALALLSLTWGTANQLGTWTFIVLWLMRWSTKLNIFFGVPNLHEEFWPEHLRYLSSYVSNKPMNLLFPLSVTLATLLTAVFLSQAWLGRSDEFAATSAMLLAAIALLGLLEHWLLVLPLSDSKLWQWGYAAHERRMAERMAAQNAADRGLTTAGSKAA